MGDPIRIPITDIFDLHSVPPRTSMKPLRNTSKRRTGSA